MKNPILRNTYRSAKTAIDHNQYIVGDLTYQPNFGLREVAYFDCYPRGTTASFVGTWSNYPYFKSGNVVIDSIEYGLFTVRPRYDEISADIEANKSAEGQQTRSRQVVHAKEGGNCPEVTETRSCK